MSALGEKIRKQREFKHDVQGVTFICRRPSRVQWVRLAANEATIVDIAREFVVGWEGVSEATFIRSGRSDEIDFDKDVWSEWLDDTPDLWEIGAEIQRRYIKSAEDKEEREKN